MANNISTILLASKAIDKIYKDNILLETVKAGPAYYLSKQLNKMRHPHTRAKGAVAKVNIYLKKHGETGEVVQPDNIDIPSNMNNYTHCIISTISSNALNLKRLDNFSGVTFVDIQGFLRGTKKNVNQKLIKLASLDCIKYIKGNKKEVSKFLKINSNNLKNKIIIETQGRQSIKVTRNNTETFFKIKNTVNPPNTIGAGDTFLASFTHYITQQYSTSATIKNSIKDTHKFLVSKL